MQIMIYGNAKISIECNRRYDLKLFIGVMRQLFLNLGKRKIIGLKLDLSFCSSLLIGNASR